MDTMTHQSPAIRHEETMASVDRAWWRMETPVNPMVINAVLTFKSPILHSAFIQHILSKFTCIPRFRCNVVSGAIRDMWRECELDEDYHFPLLNTELTSDTELQQVATQFINEPLSKDRPLWRMLQVEKFKQGTALVIRIHHAYADGMALIKVLLQLMDEGPLVRQFTEASEKKSKKNTPASNCIQRLQSFLPGNGKWAETLKLAEELSIELMKMGLSPGEKNVFKTPGLCGKKQLVWTPPLKLSEVKIIAKTHNAKVNDILLSSVSGAFRRYLSDLNQLSAWSELRTVIPVDLRAHVNAKALGNYFGLVFLSLPLGIGDPITRAHELNARMNELKTSKQAWLVFQLLQLFGYLPDIAEKELTRLFSSKASAVMTNVPGPPFPMHLTGSELEQVLFWVPQSGSIGTGVSVLTYNNRVQFGLMTDQQLISDPSKLIHCFNQEFEFLLLETLMTMNWPSET